jgi:hypothetical protein
MTEHRLRVWLLSGFVAFGPRLAEACEMSDNLLREGLVLNRLADPPEPALLPRNLAVLRETLSEAELAEPVRIGRDDRQMDVAVLLEPLRAGSVHPRSEQVYTVAEPLPVGASVDGFTVGDYIDDAAPSTPRIVGASLQFNDGNSGCARSSCGDYTNVTVTLEPGTDDRQDSSSLVYAVYLGTTRDRALSAATAIAVLNHDGGDEVFLSALVDNDWSESDTYLSVSAWDAAGNESPRTAPVRVNDEPGACSLGSRRTRARFPFALFAAALAIAVARRKARPPG